MRIPDRVRIVFAMAITVSCGAHQLAAGLSGEPYQTFNGSSPSTYSPEPQRTVVAVVNPPPATTPTYLEVALTTSSVVPAPTLENLIIKHFKPEDHQWALRVAFCESSAQPDDISSEAVHSSSGASGWFQHLPKFWEERSTNAGVPKGDIMEPEINVIVAAWLLYNTPQQEGHWYPSEHCWIER